MSPPTKGMVAGKPIQTGAQSKEFDEGYDAIFGKGRKPVRGRWVYTSGGKQLAEPVQVDGDWTQPDTGPSLKSEEEVYGHAQAVDGTDISSRAKRAEYMKRHGLTDYSDFEETRKKKAEERARFYRGEGTGPEDRAELRETVGRAWYRAWKGRR